MNLKLVLLAYENTLLKFRNYPEITKDRELTSLIKGAYDMAMRFVDGYGTKHRADFAENLDKIKNKIFPNCTPVQSICLTLDQKLEIRKLQSMSWRAISSYLSHLELSQKEDLKTNIDGLLKKVDRQRKIDKLIDSL